MEKPSRNDVVLYVTNDMYGGERTIESLARFQTFIDLWKENGPFRILLSGGLANAQGLTIAQDIKQMILDEIPEAEDWILPQRDECSSDTWTQMVNSTKIFHQYCREEANLLNIYPRLFVISDRLHLRNIRRMGIILGIMIIPVISRLSGGLIYWARRFSTEVIRFLWSLFDPEHKHPSIAKRRRKAILEASRQLPADP